MDSKQSAPASDMVKIEAQIYKAQYNWLQEQLKDPKWASFDRLIVASVGTFRSLQSIGSEQPIWMARFAVSNYSLAISGLLVALSILLASDAWWPISPIQSLNTPLSLLCFAMCAVVIVYYFVSITALYAINEIYRYRFIRVSKPSAILLHLFSLILPLTLFYAALVFLKREGVSVIANDTSVNYWLLPIDLAFRGLLFDALSYLNFPIEKAAIADGQTPFRAFCFLYKLYYNYLGARVAIFFINHLMSRGHALRELK